MKNWLPLLLLLLIHSGLKAQLSGTYTIDPSKKDSGTNYTSVSEAGLDLTTGYRTSSSATKNGPGVSGPVIFKIANGNFSTYVNFTKIKGSSSTNIITFESASGDSSKVSLLFTNGNNSTLTFNSSQYINFKGITFNTHNYFTSGSLILLENGAKNINFSHCRFLGYASFGHSLIIDAANTDSNIVFNNNYFTNYTIALQGRTTNNAAPGLYNPIISNNIFDTGSIAISLPRSYNPSLLNNIISSYYPGTIGMQLSGITGGLTVTSNKISADSALIINGFTIKTGSGNVTNNMIISFRSAMSILNVKNLNVYYNTCSIYPGDYTSQFTQAIVLQNDTIKLENNIFANFANGAALGLYGTAKEIESDYNDFYVPDSAIGRFGASYTSASKEKDLIAWRSATALDSNSISYDPLFRNSFDNHAFNPNLQKGVPVSTVTTDIDNKIRGKYQTSIGANELNVYHTDAGIFSIDSIKTQYCRGNAANLYVTLINYGLDSLKSTTINWSLNGALQPALNWTGNLGPGNKIKVKLGIIVFDKTGPIHSWTEKFNSQNDSNHTNDSSGFYYNIDVRMGGQYTIGGYGADFKNFNAAENELLKSGICGPVDFLVKDSIYHEQLNLTPISGAGGANTITFESQSGDHSKAIMAFPSSNRKSDLNYVLRIDSARDYIFKNLGFVRTGNDTEAAVLVLTTLSDSNTFTGNMFVSTKVYPKNSYDVSKNYTVDLQGTNRINFTGNLVKNGSAGIMIGDSLIYDYFHTPPVQRHNNTIAGNIIDSSYYSGITGSGIHLTFSGNTVSNIRCVKPIAISLSGDSFMISNNKVFMPRGGIGISPFTNTLCDVTNNFISITGSQFYNVAQGISFDPGIYTNPYTPCKTQYNIENNNIYITGHDTGSTNLYIFDPSTDYEKSTINIFVYNNNLVNSAAGKTISFFNENHINSDYNNLVSNGMFIGKVYNNLDERFNYYKTMFDWTKAYGIDSNSIGITAWFKSTIDLHAQNPKLAHKGKPLVNIKTDIDGIKRNSKLTIGANEINPIPGDAGVSALIWPPTDFCAGVNDYKISLRNYGADTVYSDSIFWSLLNVPQTPYGWTGKIAPGDSAIVDIGNGTLMYSTDSDYFASKNPNGNIDSNRTNDSAGYTFHSSMFGTYTIGGTNPDFKTIGQAVSTLVKSHVCNPVVFKIRDGVYNEQVSIPNVIDVSPTYTVTFESESGDSNKVIITYPSSANKSDPNYIIQLDSASHFYFKNLTFQRTGTNPYAKLIDIFYYSSFITFTGCRFIGVKCPVSTSIDAELVGYENTLSPGTLLRNNVFKYGTYAINDGEPWVVYGYYEDTVDHNIIDSSITGLQEVGFASNNIITNFVYAGIEGSSCYGNRLYSPINITHAIGNSDSLVNNIISTAAPLGLYNCAYIIYNNIALFYNPDIKYCSYTPVAIYSDNTRYGSFLIRNNNILLMSNQYIVYSFKTNSRLDSNLTNYNNVYSYQNNEMSVYINSDGTLFSNLESGNYGFPTWGTYYSYYHYNGLPDYNSVDIDAMPISIRNPETQNMALEHTGTPVSRVSRDIYGNLRDSISPTIGAVEIVKKNNHNLGNYGILNGPVCGDTGYSITVIVQNRTKNKETNIPVFARVNVNGVTQTVSGTIPSIAGNALDTFTLQNHLNLYLTGTYMIKTWVALDSDQNRDDDTSNTSVFIIGNEIPHPKDTMLCSAGAARLTLDGLKSADQVAWYKNANDTKALSTNDTLVTGTLTGDTTFYVTEQVPQDLHYGLKDNSVSDYQYSNSKAGYDFTTLKAFTIDSVTVYPKHSGYFRVITFDGTNFAYHSYKVTVAHQYQAVRVALKITFNAVSDYTYLGIDSISTGDMIYSAPQNSGNCTFYSGITNLITFNYIGYPYFYNWSISTQCPVEKFPYRVHVGRGSAFSLDKNPDFGGKYNTGTLADPDQVCTYNAAIYNLFTSFADADYGSTWKIKSFSFQSLSGSSSKDTLLIKPSKKGIGKFIFIPSSFNSSDSIYKLSITIGSVSDSGCDTMLTRYIRVSASDRAKFSVESNVCAGNTVYFKDSSAEDTTEKHSWNFGDATNSNAVSPSHIYTTGGIYKAVLTITNATGCSDTFSRKINVYDVPVTKMNSSATLICSGAAVQFSDATVSYAGYKRKWYFGDGSTDTNKIVNHIYANAGQYRAKLVLSNNNQCSASDSQAITVAMSPKAKLVYDSAGCVGTVINYGDSSTNTHGQSRFLFYGDGKTEFAYNIASYSFSTAGTYKTELIITNDNGCGDTAYGHVTIYALPTPQFIAGKSLCLSDSGTFTDISNPKSVSRTWDFGDNSRTNNTAATVHHKYVNTGTYNIGLIAINTHGCQGSTYKQLTVTTNPKPVFSYDSAACISSGISLVDNTVAPNETRSWNFGDGSANALQSQVYQYTNAGKYTVRITVKDNNGCMGYDSAKVTVHPLPDALFYIKDSARCLSNAFVIADSSSISAGFIKNWAWDFGDNTTSGLQNPPDHTYSQSGTYDISLKLTSNYGCKDSVDKEILIYPQPEASFTLNDTTACLSNNSFAFTNSSTIPSGRISVYTWNFGDGNQSAFQKPSKHTYAKEGNYIAYLKVTSTDGCTDSSITNIHIYPQPKIAFAVNDSTQCLHGNDFKFKDSSSIASGSLATWNWDFGNAKAAATQNAETSYTSPGTYPVKLTISSDKGCTASRTDTMTVNAAPLANAGHNEALCAGTTDSLGSAASAGSNYSWTSVPAGFTSTKSRVAISPAHNTTYVLTETFSATGCKTTDSVFIRVKPHPSARFKDTLIGSDYIFIALDSSFSSSDYHWDFGDGSAEGSGYHVGHAFPKKKLYNVTLFVSDTDGCSEEGGSTINVTISGIAETVTRGLHIKVYPNPFEDNTIIECTTTDNTSLSINLYDLNGKRIGNIADKNVQAGIYQWNINAENYQLKKGVYILKVITPQGETNYRIVKM